MCTVFVHCISSPFFGILVISFYERELTSCISAAEGVGESLMKSSCRLRPGRLRLLPPHDHVYSVACGMQAVTLMHWAHAVEKGTNWDKIVCGIGEHICLLIEKTRICSNFLAKVTEIYSMQSATEQFVVPELFFITNKY